MAIEAARITEISGRAIPLRGDDTDTDRITPADALKEPTFEKMADYLFRDERRANPNHTLDDPRYQGASILFVGMNFGIGSSRETAPQAIQRFGVRAIIGGSFAEIFAGNCNVLGIAAMTAPPDELARLMEITEQRPQTRYRIDLNAKSVSYEVDGGAGAVALDIPESRRVALVTGSWSPLTMLAANHVQVRAVAAALPYVENFQ